MKMGMEMLELTVSMPAYNTSKYIREAIISVLKQENVSFELIVVDDGSKDNTADVVESFGDPRIKLIRNRENKGPAYCHNLVIEFSRAPFIAHVDSDDTVLAGAFRKMIDKLKNSPGTGQVHCYFYIMDEFGKATRSSIEKRKKYMLTNLPPDIDYKRELVVRGAVMNHLRTYRREVFDKVGNFNANIRCGEDLDMALRVIDKYDIKLVPEFLYCFRMHGNNTTSFSRFRELIYFKQRLSICRRLLKNKGIRFFSKKEYDPHKLFGIAFRRALSLQLKGLMPRGDFNDADPAAGKREDILKIIQEEINRE